LSGALALVVVACNLGSPPVTYPVPSRLVETADLNGDGALDVVSAGPGAYAALLNDGTGRLHGTPVTTVLDVEGFALGDVDGDDTIDRVDLHIPDTGTGALFLLRGDGGGGFGAPEHLSDTDARDVDLADVDGDGDLDLLTTGPAASFSLLQVRRNDGNGGFGAPDSSSYVPCGSLGGGYFPRSGRELTHADFDGDGDQDVVVAATCESEPGQGWPPSGPPHPEVVQLYNDGTGAFAASTAHSLPDSYGSTAGLSVGDVNDDHLADVVVGNRDDTSLTLFPTGLDRVTVPTPDRPGDVDLADIDDDGHLDIVVTSAGRGTATVLYGDGHNAFPESHAVLTGGDVVDTVTSGRIDDDRSTDLVFGNDSGSASPKVAVLLNTQGRS
jgi:hypothetical protein